jgi:hypothetical protein
VQAVLPLIRDHTSLYVGLQTNIKE